MYCRGCGALLNEKAEICVKFGCCTLNGREYYRKCGAKTTENQQRVV